MTTRILSWLLHHANRCTKSPEYYAIKKTLLARYGSQVGYDIQHIAGKKCRTCGGTGTYTGYHTYSGEPWHDTCGHCWWGWFKLPQWICLARITFGKYIFHMPLVRERCVENPFNVESLGWEPSDRPIIEGYVEHNGSDYGHLAAGLLFLIYDRHAFIKWLRAYIRTIGNGYYTSWSSPYRCFHNIVHILRRGTNSIAWYELKMWLTTRRKPPEWIRVDDAPYNRPTWWYDDDRPF